MIFTNQNQIVIKSIESQIDLADIKSRLKKYLTYHIWSIIDKIYIRFCAEMAILIIYNNIVW